jgi:hypothetical protein
MTFKLVEDQLSLNKGPQKKQLNVSVAAWPFCPTDGPNDQAPMTVICNGRCKNVLLTLSVSTHFVSATDIATNMTAAVPDPSECQNIYFSG